MLPLIEYELRCPNRGLRSGVLVEEREGQLIVFDFSYSIVPRADLLWLSFRWTGGEDKYNLPSLHMVGRKYPAAYPPDKISL